MSHPSKAKGTRFEVACANFLREAGYTEVYRMATQSEHDCGDLGGLPLFAVECRDRQKIDLAKNVDDANKRAANKEVPYGVTMMKRRNKNIADAYVAMDLKTFVAILDAMQQTAQ